MSGEKTEKPTPKRLGDARKKGQVGRTQDLGAWLALGGVVAFVPMTITKTADGVVPMFTGLRQVAADPTQERMIGALGQAGAAIVPAVVPFLAVAVLLAVASSIAQGGLLWATEAARPKFSRLNPATGIKNLFSFHSSWQLVKSLVKTVVIGGALYISITGVLPLLMTGGLTLQAAVQAVQSGTTSLVRIAVAVGLVLAGVDFIVQKRKTAKDLRMSKQEIKDEAKNADGNPEVKAAIKGKQRAISRNRMLAAVKTADVVVVNPTHVAVALKYEPMRGAPRVVAKGAGHVASRIRAEATEAGVPLVSDVPLARTLYAACDLEQEVPEHLFVAVAQVLAFVMALKKRGSASGLHANPTPVAVEVPDHPLLRSLPPVS